MADDQQRRPIVGLSATLAQRGVACRPTGADLPINARMAAIRRTAPVALLLWSQLPETADPYLLTTLPQTRPHLRRRTRLGRHSPCTTDRAAQLAAGSH